MPKGTHACIFDQHQSNVMRYDEESCANTWNLHAIKAFEISFLDLSSHLRFWKAKLWTTKKMWNPPLRRIPWRKDEHDLVDACHVFGDQPLGLRFSCLSWSGRCNYGDKISILCGQMPPFRGSGSSPTSSEGYFFLYLYLRNVVLHLVLSWRRFFFSHRLQCYRFAVFETP